MMWLNLQIFGFKALWSPYFLLFICGIGIVYFLITVPYRHKFEGSEKPKFKEQIVFYIGLFLLYILKGSPIDLLSHIMFSAHMLQTALLYFIFPLVMIKGIPKWLWRKIVNSPGIKQIFGFFTNPLVALMLFSSILSLYHMPVVFDFSKSSLLIHGSMTIIILLAAFFMWWLVIPPLKEFEILTPVVKIFYLAGSAAIITVACALIIFSSAPLFSAYSAEGTWIQAMSLCVPGDVLSGLAPEISGPEMFSPLSTMHDQQFGGAIMMGVQSLVYVFILWIIFYKQWFTKESFKTDPLPEGYTVPESN